MEYTEAFKQAMIKKMLGTPRVSATALSREVGVSKSALARWRNLATTGVCSGHDASSAPSLQRVEQRGASEKLRIVNHAATLNEEDLGAFLRKEGVFDVHIERWRTEMLQGLSGEETNKELRAQLREERKKNQSLERELRRKEKALAEAAALLVLKKKVEDYLREGEDNDMLQSKGCR